MSSDHGISKDLETCLKHLTGNDRLRMGYLEPLTGGFDADTYAFRLLDAPPILSGDLVLRLFRTPGEAHRVSFETAILQGVGNSGYPVPRIIAETTSWALAGRPFILMERLAGIPLLNTMSMESQQEIVEAATLLGRCHAELHDLDPSQTVDALAQAGVEPATRTPERLRERT